MNATGIQPKVGTVPYDGLLGVPYLHGGRSKDGMDCWGLILEVYARMGVAIPDVFQEVEKEWAKKDLDGTFAGLAAEDTEGWIQQRFGKWKKLREAEVGCIVAFSMKKRVPDHAGIIVEAGRVLHCLEGAGVILTRLTRDPWAERIVGYYVYDGRV